MESSLTHGVANAQARFPDEVAILEELGLKNLNDIEAAIKRYGIDCDYERTGVIDVSTIHHSPVVPTPSCATTTSNFGRWARRWSCSTVRRCAPRSTRPPTPVVCGARIAPRLVDPARLVWGLKAAAESLGVVDLRRHQGHVGREGRRGRDHQHAARRGPRRQGGAGHQRVQAAAEADQPLRRTGLRLLHGHRTADPATAGRHRLDQPSGTQRHPQPVPLLPTHRGQPHPVGRLRRHLLLARQGQHRDSRAAPRRGPSCRSTSSPRSLSWRV